MRGDLYLLVIIFVVQMGCVVELRRMWLEILAVRSSVSHLQEFVEWYVRRMQNPHDPRFKVPPPRTARM